MAGSKAAVARNTKPRSAAISARNHFRQRHARSKCMTDKNSPNTWGLDTAFCEVVPVNDANANITETSCIKVVPILIEGEQTQNMPECDRNVSPVVDFLTSLGSPAVLLDGSEHCNEVIEKFDGGSDADKHVMLLWLHTFVRQLALSKSGCHVVQKAFEVARGSDRDMIINELKDHIVELYESPHGNHVLSKAIEVLPAGLNVFVIAALHQRTSAVSKHRFGCRVICRLIEHCDEDLIGEILDEVVSEAGVLAKHAYGNFVVQSTLEHTSFARRSMVLSCLLSDFSALAMHRTGSLVAQRALDYCGTEGQALAIQALLQGGSATSIVEIACSRYGSYVIEQVAGLRQAHCVAGDIARILASSIQRLRASEHAERVITAFGIPSADPLASVS